MEMGKTEGGKGFLRRILVQCGIGWVLVSTGNIMMCEEGRWIHQSGNQISSLGWNQHREGIQSHETEIYGYL